MSKVVFLYRLYVFLHDVYLHYCCSSMVGVVIQNLFTIFVFKKLFTYCLSCLLLLLLTISSVSACFTLKILRLKFYINSVLQGIKFILVCSVQVKYFKSKHEVLQSNDYPIRYKIIIKKYWTHVGSWVFLFIY